MKFKHILWGVAMIGVLGAVGCGSSETPKDESSVKAAPKDGGAGPSKKEYKIVMIAKSSSNPVFTAAQTGAQDAAKDLGAKNGVKITIDWRTPNDEDPQVQAQRIGQAVNDGADAILVSCSNAEILTGAIDDAVGKGVPVMTFDSDAPKSKRFAFYGANDLECGAQVMSELSKIIGGKGNVAILAGNQNAPNLQARVKGVQDEAKKYPGIKIVGVFNHAETAEDASAEVTKDMNAHPEINAWAMIGGWPLFATSLLTLDPNKVKIVSVDALPQELPYIDKGIAPVLLAQPVYDWGYKSVGFIVDKVVLHKDVAAVNKMDLVRVSMDSLGEWATTLQKWGFKVDAKYLAMAKKK